MKKIKNIIVTLLASCMIFAITPVQINASDALEEKVTINYEDTTIQETVIGNERHVKIDDGNTVYEIYIINDVTTRITENGINLNLNEFLRVDAVINEAPYDPYEIELYENWKKLREVDTTLSERFASSAAGIAYLIGLFAFSAAYATVLCDACSTAVTFIGEKVIEYDFQSWITESILYDLDDNQHYKYNYYAYSDSAYENLVKFWSKETTYYDPVF